MRCIFPGQSFQIVSHKRISWSKKIALNPIYSHFCIDEVSKLLTNLSLAFHISGARMPLAHSIAQRARAVVQLKRGGGWREALAIVLFSSPHDDSHVETEIFPRTATDTLFTNREHRKKAAAPSSLSRSSHQAVRRA